MQDYIIIPSQPLVIPTEKQYIKKESKDFLSVGAIFKNESYGIKEWIEHYIYEGVDHFYLIDNGSTDNYLKEIQEFVDQGLITIFYDDEKWAQEKLYNNYFIPIKNRSKWLLIADLDEFVYARNGFHTIADFLKSRSMFVGLIRIPWKMFGSSGHVKQPAKVIQAFVKRSKYDGQIKPGMKGAKKSLSKAIVRTKYLKRIFIHTSKISRLAFVLDANGKLLNNLDKSYQTISEELLRKSYLHLNHYAIQSLEWFMEVKSKRGAADGAVHEDVRNKDYFEEYDKGSNDMEDIELANKQYYK